jgi:hypothetical protein
MTLTPGDDLNETIRQRTRDQIALLREAHGDAILVDTDDDADFNFVCSSEHVLINTGDIGIVQEYFTGRMANDDVFSDVGNMAPEQPRDELFARYVLPARSGSQAGDKSMLVTLDEMELDPTVGGGIVRPDHLVHICPRSSQCPATEPSETGINEPWPPAVTGDDGHDVTVVVIDGGWHDPRSATALAAGDPLPWQWLTDVDGQPEPNGVYYPGTTELRPYAGHGTFIAGIVQSVAPACTVRVLSLTVDPNFRGGGVFESELITQLDKALELNPHIINLSAGCPTRNNHPARAFENWWDNVSPTHQDLVLVASAGNNASPWGFWPASFDWAVGVGSIDHDGRVSDFSNWGDSVDVFALGRNIVNAFPNGQYTCHEAPDKGDKRDFSNNMARWSGTSFSAPLVAGMIAAEMSHQDEPRSAQRARKKVLRLPQSTTGPVTPAGLPGPPAVRTVPRARPFVTTRVILPPP